MASSQPATLREARAQYFRDNGIAEDGGYTEKWVRIKLGPVPILFPNATDRRAALLPHDLHHVATGYDTTLVGEAEIGAWELASGCRHYYAAWILNLAAVITGLFLAPRRVVRAFQRGWRCTNLYQLGVDAAWPEEAVSGLTPATRSARPCRGAAPTLSHDHAPSLPSGLGIPLAEALAHSRDGLHRAVTFCRPTSPQRRRPPRRRR